VKISAIGAVGVLSRARLVQNIELPRPALVRALSTATSIRLFEGLAGMHETQLAKAVTPIAARKLSPVQPALAHAALTL
jgi:hypothetical protein